MNIKRSIVIRVRVIFILVALAAAAIPYKVAVVQLIGGEKWKAKAEQVNFQYRKVPQYFERTFFGGFCKNGQ